MTKGSSSHKFLQSVDDEYYYLLRRMALARGVSVQELVRAVIIPDWIRRSVEKSIGGRDNRPADFKAQSQTKFDFALWR